MRKIIKQSFISIERSYKKKFKNTEEKVLYFFFNFFFLLYLLLLCKLFNE